MDLTTSKTFRCLDRKAKIMGFELFDVLMIGVVLSAMNLFVGNVPYRLLVTWTPALALAGVLWVGKRGKPENFLLHYVRFHLSPNYYCAFKEAKNKWKKKV